MLGIQLCEQIDVLLFIYGDNSQVGESGHKQLDSYKYTMNTQCAVKGKTGRKRGNVTKWGRHQGLSEEKG